MAEGKKAEELSANQKIALVLAAMGADNASAVYKLSLIHILTLPTN